jgi:hypothetical protein
MEKCLAAYGHMLKILEMNNDNYFKRTQILMIVAQSALLIAFVKLFTGPAPNGFKNPLLMKPIILLAIAVLGIIASSIWLRFIERQCTVLNLCKTYLRAIEDSLMRLGVPLGYWTYEGVVSYPEEYKQHQKDMIYREHLLFPKWLFPCENKQKKIGLTKIEQGIAWILLGLWIVLIVLVLVSWCLCIWAIPQPTS